MVKKSELFKTMIVELSADEKCIEVNQWLDGRIEEITEKYNLGKNEHDWMVGYSAVNKNITCITTAIKVVEAISRLVDVEDDVDLSDMLEVEKLTREAMENYSGATGDG